MDGRKDRKGMVDGAGDCEPTEGGAKALVSFFAEGAVAERFEFSDWLWACVCLSLFLNSCWLWTHSKVHCLFVLAQFVHGPSKSSASSSGPVVEFC